LRKHGALLESKDGAVELWVAERARAHVRCPQEHVESPPQGKSYQLDELSFARADWTDEHNTLAPAHELGDSHRVVHLTLVQLDFEVFCHTENSLLKVLGELVFLVLSYRRMDKLNCRRMSQSSVRALLLIGFETMFPIEHWSDVSGAHVVFNQAFFPDHLPLLPRISNTRRLLLTFSLLADIFCLLHLSSLLLLHSKSIRLLFSLLN